VARPLRLFLPGYWYHVTVRGQRGQPLFFSPDDRVSYLQFLDKELLRKKGSIGAFSLMSNHAHLLLRQGDIPLNRIFHPVNSRFAVYFNRNRGTKGHVFQGRPVCKIVLSDSYMDTLIGYIHNNPVKAGLTPRAVNYRWSSWYWFAEKKCSWISLKSFRFPPGFEEDNRSDKFQALTETVQGSVESSRYYVGTEKMYEELRKSLNKENDRGDPENLKDRRSMKEIAEECCRGSGFTVKDLKGKSRDRKISKIRHKAMAEICSSGYGYSETGRYFNRTFSMAIKSYKTYGKPNKL